MNPPKFVFIEGDAVSQLQRLEKITYKTADEIVQALIEPMLNQIFDDTLPGREGVLQLCFLSEYDNRGDAQAAADGYNELGLIEGFTDSAVVYGSGNACCIEFVPDLPVNG